MSDTKFNLYTFAALFLVLIIDAMGFGLVFPVIGPLIMSKTGSIVASTMSIFWRDFLYGVTMSSFAVCMFFGAPFLGDLSDRIGRKKVLLLCLYGTALGMLISVYGIAVKSLLLLILGRAFAGFMCGSQALAQAAIVDMSLPEKKAANLSLITFATCIGFALGPFLGGMLVTPSLIAKYGFSAPLFVTALLAILNGTILLFTFTETFYPKVVQKLHLAKGLEVFISAFTHKKIRWLALVYLTAELGWSIYFQYTPLFLIKKYSYTGVQIGHLMAFMGALFSVALLWIVRLTDKYITPNRGACYFFLLTALGFFIILFGGEWSVWLGAIPACIGGALFYVALLALFSNAVGKDAQGWVMGVFAAAAAASWSVGGVLSGMLDMFGIYAPFIIAGGLLIAAIVIMLKHNNL